MNIIIYKTNLDKVIFLKLKFSKGINIYAFKKMFFFFFT